MSLDAAPELWRCGHVKTPENTHGGTERTHAQCWTCRRAAQQRADERYRNTFKGWSKHLVVERRRRWRNGSFAGMPAHAQKLLQLAKAEGKVGPGSANEWLDFVTAYGRERSEVFEAQFERWAAAQREALEDRQAARREAAA